MSRKMMSDLDNKTGYYGYSSESGNVSGKDKKKKENKGGSVLGVILALIQLVLSGLLVYQVVSANILSTTYLAVLVIVLVVLFAIADMIWDRGPIFIHRKDLHRMERPLEF